MTTDDRDVGIREALDGAVLTIQPDPDRRIAEIRRRGSIRRGARWVAIGTSLGVFVFAVGWAALRLRPDGGRPAEEAGWVTFRDQALGWTVEHPADWFVSSFENVCMAGFTGTMVSNVCRTPTSIRDQPTPATGLPRLRRCPARR